MQIFLTPGWLSLLCILFLPEFCSSVCSQVWSGLSKIGMLHLSWIQSELLSGYTGFQTKTSFRLSNTQHLTHRVIMKSTASYHMAQFNTPGMDAVLLYATHWPRHPNVPLDLKFISTTFERSEIFQRKFLNFQHSWGLTNTCLSNLKIM